MTDPPADWGRRIEAMFSRLVPYYDLLNRLLSLRRDVWWRRAVVRGLALPPQALILDLAAGTMDVALEAARHYPRAHVVPADFSLPMLLQGRHKAAAASLARQLTPVVADALHLPFPPATFDAVTMAFGIRNVQERHRALTEMRRVLKPGGRLAILEFAPPAHGWRLRLYRLYLEKLLPRVGQLFSRHSFAYTYLAQSIAAFPSPPAFCAELRQAGFAAVAYQNLTHGIACIFWGRQPGADRAP